MSIAATLPPTPDRPRTDHGDDDAYAAAMLAWEMTGSARVWAQIVVDLGLNPIPHTFPPDPSKGSPR